MDCFCKNNCPFMWNDGFKIYCKKYDNRRLYVKNDTEEEIDIYLNDDWRKNVERMKAKTYKTKDCMDKNDRNFYRGLINKQKLND